MQELHGITITFNSGFLAEILDVVGPGVSRGSYETSHKGTSKARTFLPTALYDPGGVRVVIGYDPTTAPPIDADPESMVINWADSASSTATATAFMTDGEPSAPMDDKATMEVTLKLSGEISYA